MDPSWCPLLEKKNQFKTSGDIQTNSKPRLDSCARPSLTADQIYIKRLNSNSKVTASSRQMSPKTDIGVLDVCLWIGSRRPGAARDE